MTPWTFDSLFFRRAAIAIALLLLSLITGFSQIKTEGLSWQEAHYLPMLEAVLDGSAAAPERFRILSDGFVAMSVRMATAIGFPRPAGLTFVALRLLQNLVLFSMAFAFYRRLQIRPYAALIGLSALAWGMTQSNYGADLGFSIYTDMVLYLAGAMALLAGRYRWLLPITIAAALNRETSILIPIMALACAFRTTPRISLDRAIARPAFLAMGAYILVYGALRAFLDTPTVNDPGMIHGIGFLRLNLQSVETWGHALGTLGIIPVLAWMSWRVWHPLLRPIFWSVVPVWFVFHLLFAPLDPSRVLLLPQILVFIPGMLGGLAGWRTEPDKQPVGAPAC